jgi:hypothetical protein
MKMIKCVHLTSEWMILCFIQLLGVLIMTVHQLALNAHVRRARSFSRRTGYDCFRSYCIYDVQFGRCGNWTCYSTLVILKCYRAHCPPQTPRSAGYPDAQPCASQSVHRDVWSACQELWCGRIALSQSRHCMALFS